MDQMQVNLKPPYYIRIKNNKPVGNVRLFNCCNTSNSGPCDCSSADDKPCGPDSRCLNRLLLTECNPEICPAGQRCCNQQFEKREYPPLIPYHTDTRGWGLKCSEHLKKGQFIIEYIGELIDELECRRRMKIMQEKKDDNFYFLTIDKDRILDAGPKGNDARFMNHSCQPNCETQKWTVNGTTRVGLFALRDIPADEELTFNYNLQCLEKEKKICCCNAPNCSGYIGVKAKPVELMPQKPPKSKKVRKEKGKRRQSRTETPIISTETCFICGDAGDLVVCKNRNCNKFYHLGCVNLDFPPEGRWICSWHNCNICSKRTIRRCIKCVNSYCPSHAVGNIRHDKILGFVCSKHDLGITASTLCLKNSLEIGNFDNEVLSHFTQESEVTSTTD